MYNNKRLILDTETTGLANDAEVIEIAVIDADSGEVLLNTLIKPKLKISQEATEIHGITNEMVETAPSWSEVYDQFVECIKDSYIYIYCAEFDVRMIHQTCKAYDLAIPSLDTTCVMKWYADKYIADEMYSWQKLSEAAGQQNISLEGVILHRALADCLLTQQLVRRLRKDDLKLSPFLAQRIKNATRARLYAKRRDIIHKAILPEGVRIVEEDGVRTVVDNDGIKYPYFGCVYGGYNSAHTTISRIKISEVDDYEFVGMCVSTYGNHGYVVKRKDI